MSEYHNHLLVSEEYFRKIFYLIPNSIYVIKKVENNLILIDYNEVVKLFCEGKIDELLG